MPKLEQQRLRLLVRGRLLEHAEHLTARPRAVAGGEQRARQLDPCAQQVRRPERDHRSAFSDRCSDDPRARSGVAELRVHSGIVRPDPDHPFERHHDRGVVTHTLGASDLTLQRLELGIALRKVGLTRIREARADP